LVVALLFLVTNLLKVVPLGAGAQLLGLVTFQLSYPVIICRARLLLLGQEYEEAAMDLGASPMAAQRRVILPMLVPAIVASAVLVFAAVIDDFVIVRYLSGDSSTEPTSVKIYNTARAAPTPALNALATLMLVAAMLTVVAGFLIYRWLSHRAGDRESIGSFAGET
jgi:spermidine/putrescine transport system permease protein